MLEKVDTDGNGEIDIAEFTELMKLESFSSQSSSNPVSRNASAQSSSNPASRAVSAETTLMPHAEETRFVPYYVLPPA